ncbi:MAG: VOC family protein [Bacteroidia bacterium]
MLALHHTGFIVKDIDAWEKKMIYEEKVGDVIDPNQNARLALYKNFGNIFIELIQPLSEKAFAWNSLVKSGDHFNHFCYSVNSVEEMEQNAKKYKLISVLAPLPALLFNGKKVAFYYTRNYQVVEFLING